MQRDASPIAGRLLLLEKHQAGLHFIISVEGQDDHSCMPHGPVDKPMAGRAALLLIPEVLDLGRHAEYLPLHALP